MDTADQTFTFAARIQKIWIMRCVDVPREISGAIRKAAGGKALHVPVRGWIEGLAMESTLVPGGRRALSHSRAQPYLAQAADRRGSCGGGGADH